ncbi:BrnT family toxin [Paraburkholderia sediminicola]
MYSLSFTMRGETLRAISLRKANRREVLKYVDEA